MFKVLSMVTLEHSLRSVFTYQKYRRPAAAGAWPYVTGLPLLEHISTLSSLGVWVYRGFPQVS